MSIDNQNFSLPLPLDVTPDALQAQGSNSDDPDRPLPRAKRRRARAREDRGLPPDKELFALAREYLTRQRKHWPDMLKAGLLPEPSDDLLGDMVEDFKRRHRGGTVDPQSVAPFLKYCSLLAGNYDRYSCDNSGPNSILDQMVDALDLAREERRFICWSYIYADYSISGLDSARRGYSSYKELLEDKEHLIETTYIDEFTRASRLEIEWWNLALMSRQLKKRMIGCVDRFDVNDPNWDVWLTIFGLLSRLFIKQLVEKVRRGRRGGARRGTTLGKYRLGFTRKVARDQNGNVIYRPDGRPRTVRCIDPESLAHRLLMYELYLDKGWSAYKISTHFNELKVDGWDGWSNAGIKDILRGEDAIGVFIEGRTRREYDHNNKRWITVKNPHSEWIVRYDPTLALISIPRFAAARRKLAAMRAKSPLTGRKWSRNEKCATTLFSGSLYCSYCKEEITLLHSDSKYKSMYCHNGPGKVHGCELSSSKSVSIIENCLLGWLADVLITEDTLRDWVIRGNKFLMEERRKPRVNLAPQKRRERELQAALEKLMDRIEGQVDPAICATYDKRISEHQKELNKVRDRIREGEASNTVPPPPLDLERVRLYVRDMRAMLNREIPAAAKVIKDLFGRVEIRQDQEPIPGRKKGARWIAEFRPNLGKLLCQAAAGGSYPDRVTLEFLSSRIWRIAEPVEVEVRRVPKYEILAPRFVTLNDKGISVVSLASAHGMSQSHTAAILDFGRTGRRPKWKLANKKGGKPLSKTYKKRELGRKYIEIAPDVAMLREKEKMSWSRIIEWLRDNKGISVAMATVRRAYDFAHAKEVQAAVEQGRNPKRGQSTILGEQKYQKIRSMIGAGKKAKDIAVTLDCGISTVNREKRRLQQAKSTRSA